ncbi:hypothetical protein CR513_20266, partial [Mucuna pruriens]
MVIMFIDTFPSPYYNKVVGNIASNFTDLVVVKERIELGIRCFSKKPASEKKKGKANAVLVEPIFPQGKANAPCQRNKKLVEIIPLKPLEPPYPRSYDPNARCDCHGGAIGHATERGVAINAISHENRDEVERASKMEKEEGPSRCTMDSANQVEEGAHSSWLKEAESASIAYIEGNGNLHPKSLIIHCNWAS